MKSSRSAPFGSLQFPAVLAFLGLLTSTGIAFPAPFSIQGPGVNPADFRLTTFAQGLGYPVGMAPLPDGSLLVAVSKGSILGGNTTGDVIRLVDANGDGIADGPGQVLYSGVKGGPTSLRLGGTLVFVTGQGAGKPITILRTGATPEAPLTWVGEIAISYPPGGWLHPHSALGLRETPGTPGSFDLFFQLGSDANFANTTRTATLSSTDIPGASGTLQGESIYRLTITDGTSGVSASNLTRVAQGLRNPAGFAFQAGSGDLYFEDNGIDGLVDANEPTSADELNRIAAAEIGGSGVEDFGFPSNYTAYRTGARVGGAGIQPLVEFQPLPNPVDGSESEGPNDVAFAPVAFPEGLNLGIFVGFHGRFSLGGITNEENPLVYVDLATGHYFHFIGNDEPGVGHLDGLLSTPDSLFIADIATSGKFSGPTGAIYQLKALGRPVLSFQRTSAGLELAWDSGVLQAATNLSEPWKDVATVSSPHTVTTEGTASFFRVRR